MSTDPRWTDETVELIELAIGDVRYDDGSTEQAVNVLGKLADAGLLVPVDADRDERRGVFIPETGQVSRCGTGLCEHTEEEQRRARVRTLVSFTTPWKEPTS